MNNNSICLLRVRKVQPSIFIPVSQMLWDFCAVPHTRSEASFTVPAKNSTSSRAQHQSISDAFISKSKQRKGNKTHFSDCNKKSLDIIYDLNGESILARLSGKPNNCELKLAEICPFF